MKGLGRYARMWISLAKFSLLGELAFRGNFLIKVFVELLWLAILLLFNFTIFEQTTSIADWTRDEYLFFIGCYFAMGGLLETLFLDNCNQFADLVRTGELDFFLLKPIDEQFLISCKHFDWSCAPNVLMGFGIMAWAFWSGGWPFNPLNALLFLILFAAGAALAYGFLLLLTSASVWFMRNQSLYEMWWLFSTLMRYPSDIFKGTMASPAGLFFSFVVPIMLVTNVPACVMVKPLYNPWLACYAVVSAVVVIWVSRRVFRAALQRYRSASS
jgi:ABC-2 type transport system permease protein